MVVAHIRGDGSFGEIFRIYGVASRVVGTDTGDGEFAGLPADLRGLHTVRHGKARIGHALVHTGHNLFPDSLVEGGSAVFLGQLLIVVTAAPDACGIVRSVSDEPDIVVGGRRSALAGIGHAGNIGRRAGGAGAGARTGKLSAAFHGIRHGIRQQECRGIF